MKKVLKNMLGLCLALSMVFCIGMVVKAAAVEEVEWKEGLRIEAKKGVMISIVMGVDAGNFYKDDELIWDKTQNAIMQYDGETGSSSAPAWARKKDRYAICKYEADGTTKAVYVYSDGAGTVSGNVASKPSASDDSGSSSASQETETPAAPTNTVTLAGGKVITSTVGGVYTATSVPGTAVTSPKAAVAAAAGLSEADIKAGTNVSFYVCNTRDKAAKDSLKGAADALNKKVGAYLNFDLYTISSKGKVTAVRNTAEPVNIVIGIPAHLAKSGQPFSIVCMTPEGEVIVMEDTDDNPNTITINTKVFGTYALVY